MNTEAMRSMRLLHHNWTNVSGNMIMV